MSLIVRAGADAGRLPAALSYHRAVRDHLKSREPGLWRWFASDDFAGENAEHAKLQLLKSCYRLGRASHAEPYAIAAAVAASLELELPVTLYQAEGVASGLNASLYFFVDELAVVFAGPILERLAADEVRAVLGHELSHHRLYTAEAGEIFAATRMLGWCSEQPGCHAAYVETARRFRLYTELFADRGAARACGSIEPVVSALLKLNTGLEHVTVSDYLAQTEEILAMDGSGSRESTHPEVYIRAKALTEASSDGPELAAVVRGPLDVRRLDVLDQHALATLTRHVILATGDDERFRCEARTALAREYFPSFAWGEAARPLDELAREVEGFGDPTRQYLAHVLLDVATADRDPAHPLLGATLGLADRLGLASIFEATARRELGLKKSDAARAVRTGADDSSEPTRA